MITKDTPVWVPDRRPHTAAHKPVRDRYGALVMACGWQPAREGKVISRDVAAELNCHPCIACFQLPMPEVTP